MSNLSSIALFSPDDARGPKITQLYANLESLEEGDPPRRSLFIREPGSMVSGSLAGDGDGERLLIIDPPLDVTTRFKLPPQTAALFSGPQLSVGIPLLQTMPGGVAHIRLGEQFLDIYTQHEQTVIHFPPLGLLYSGNFGSDLVVPAIAASSNGESELETLRLLARLLKQHRLRLLLPHIGTACTELSSMLGRLAADVAYLHGLRRVALPLHGQHDAQTALAESLLPADRRSPASWAVHRANLSRLAAH